MGQKRKPEKKAGDRAALDLTSRKRKRGTAAKEDFGSGVPGKFRTLMRYSSMVAEAQKEGHREHDDRGKGSKSGPTVPKGKTVELKRKRGETMSEFSARVNKAVPVKLARGRSGAANGDEEVTRGPLDPTEKRARKQSQRQLQQNTEHLAMLRRKAEKRRADMGLDDVEEGLNDEGGEFSEQQIQDKRKRKRGKSPDPWAVLLRPERQYKFNETVERPPELTIRGKLKR
ncbi:hypothetical protein PYCC9005_002365 [Savitreella phatthalungensis]